MPEQQLRDEIARLQSRLNDLRTRLKEPEEILRAIRYGEVDAFVVNAPDGEKVYSLRSADVLYRAMIEEMKEGAVALDSSGVLLYCNWHFASIMKVKCEAIIGTSIFPFVPQEHRLIFENLQSQSLSSAKRQELMLRAGDGSLVPVYVAINRILHEEQEVFCLIVTDLTEQKRRDELLAEKRRKDEFLAMLAHELRNPIAPIRNAVQLLGMPGVADSDIEYARGVIQRQVVQFTRLVDDLLDVSRLTRGKISLQLEQLELATVVASAVETARPTIDARHHELTITLSPGPLRVRGDATRLAQVVCNLLNNAAKFTPENGHIWLSVEQHDQEALICIRDTGIGIAREMLSRVFDLFTQVDATSVRSQGGLGIGLALVRNLIELHGGSVAAYSLGPGKGSEFSVRLPLLAAEPEREEANESGHHRTSAAFECKPCRILVVDDNRDAAESLVVLLQRGGHHVRLALDGTTALKEARALQPQLVLLDIGMPGTNGYEVVRQLRQLGGMENAVIVALTGYSQDDDKRRSREAGFDEHWVKPASPEALEKLLASIARSA